MVRYSSLVSRKKTQAPPDPQATSPLVAGAWWGEFQIPASTERRWSLGRSRLWLRRLPREWWIARAVESEGDEDAVEVGPAIPFDAGYEAPPGAVLQRVVFEHTDDTVQVLPALADRPVVTRPEVPLQVPPGEEVTFYAGTPLWLRVVLRPSNPPVLDEPLVPPPETWFGPSTLRGELCYLSRTHARLSPEKLHVRTDRAITPVTVRNLASSTLLLERFKVPVPQLALFEGEAGTLWTAPLIIERDDSSDLDVQLQPGPPPQALRDAPLSPARERVERLRMGRALGSLFG